MRRDFNLNFFYTGWIIPKQIVNWFLIFFRCKSTRGVDQNFTWPQKLKRRDEHLFLKPAKFANAMFRPEAKSSRSPEIDTPFATALNIK
ncbi:hypothetical protein DI43_02445 [Geobacillus sp. CAMR12739]|nr:hypothetical protein DI43_02445 [Geobacillus sp. CAMR12739]